MKIFARPVKWYHRLWLWMLPTITDWEWVDEELFLLHYKVAFGIWWLWKTEQLIYDVEKHITDLRADLHANKFGFIKILGPWKKTPWKWDKEG